MTYTEVYLGKGKKSQGGVEGRKRRILALTRVAKLCGGMTPGTRNNFMWSKEERDHAGQKGHGDNWPELFLKHLKALLLNLHSNPNAFTTFMYRESNVKFQGIKALAVPGRGSMLNN